MFFKRQPKELPRELANRLAREGKAEILERELERYALKKLAPAIQEDWYHLWGICAFQRGDREVAYHRFREANALFPQSQLILFSLGQEYEHRREIDAMFTCFDRCVFPQIYASYALAAARYAYLWNRLEKATAYIKRNRSRSRREQRRGSLAV